MKNQISIPNIMQRIADNLNVMNPPVQRALAQQDPEPIQDLVRALEAAGADGLDLNPGYLPARRAHWMGFFVDTVQDSTDLPLFLDNPSADVLAQGLGRVRRAPVLNALTAEPERLARVLPLAVGMDLDLVLLLVDEHSGVPATVEQKLALALSLWEASISAGLAKERIFVDPVLPNLRWTDAAEQLDAAVEVVRLLSSGAVLGEAVRTVAGLSNLRSGLRSSVSVKVELEALRRLEDAGLTHVLQDLLCGLDA